MTMGTRVFLLLCVGATILPVALLFNHIVPHPYMDEIFHIPQAQQFCYGNLGKWDPMITTFPGLYFVSLAYTGILLPLAGFLGLASSLPDLCTPAILRSVNVALSLLCSLLFWGIGRHLEPKKTLKRVTAKAMLLALYPLHWFFTFLYYTDVGSTTAVMAMHLAGLKRAYWISALFAAVSILFRQTNVVWAIFVTVVGLLDFLKVPVDLNGETQARDVPWKAVGDESLWRFPPEGLGGQIAKNVRRRVGVHSDNDVTTVDSAYVPPVRKPNKSVKDEGVDEKNPGGLELWPAVVSDSSLWCFVYYNGSIVVGAKDAHKVSPHFPQLLYFGVVASMAMAPLHYSPGRHALLFRVFRRPLAWALVQIGFSVAFVFVHYFSLEHPYLLADNRHYPFYLWKNIMHAHWSAKYWLIPLYLYSWWSLLHSLGKRQDWLWILVFCVGVAGVLVPAPLVEFRYYTVPFYLIALHTHIPKDEEVGVLLLLAAAYVGVNLITVYLFLYRPFHWDHESGIQRFLW